MWLTSELIIFFLQLRTSWNVTTMTTSTWRPRSGPSRIRRGSTATTILPFNRIELQILRSNVPFRCWTRSRTEQDRKVVRTLRPRRRPRPRRPSIEWSSWTRFGQSHPTREKIRPMVCTLFILFQHSIYSISTLDSMSTLYLFYFNVGLNVHTLFFLFRHCTQCFIYVNSISDTMFTFYLFYFNIGLDVYTLFNIFLRWTIQELTPYVWMSQCCFRQFHP